MRRNIISITITTILAVLLWGCCKDASFEDVTAGRHSAQETPITLSVASERPATKGAVIKRDSVEIECAPWTALVPEGTKGSIAEAVSSLSSSPIRANISLKTSGYADLYTNTVFSWNLGEAVSDGSFFLPGSATYRFNAWWPGTYSTSVGAFSYSPASAVTSQKELLYAVSEVNVAAGSVLSNVDITLQHALSQIRVRTSGTSPSITVASVALKNIKGTGRFNPVTGQFSSLSSKTDYTLALNRSTTANTFDELTSGTGRFLMIPQTLESDASLAIGFSHDSHDYTFEYPLNGMSWTKGNIYTFTVDFSSLNPVTVTGVTLDTSPVYLWCGEQETRTPTVTYSNSTSNHSVTWTSSNPSVARVTDESIGRLSAYSVGSAVITAENGGMSKSYTVYVSNVGIQSSAATIQVGQTATFSLYLYPYSGGSSKITSGVSFESESTSVASVNSSTGAATGTGAGTTFIWGHYGNSSYGKSTTGARAMLNVEAAPAVTTHSLTLDATPPTLTVGDTYQLAYHYHTFEGGVETNSVSVTPTSFSGYNSGRISVSSGGLVTALSAGTTTVTATYSGCTATADVTVVALPHNPASVTLNASGDMCLWVGETDSRTATVHYTDSSTDHSVTWSSDAPGIASVNASTGVVTAHAVGTATITATAGSLSASYTVRVSSIEITPASATLVVGNTQQFNLRLRHPDGTLYPDPTTAWASSATSRAAVNSSGLATAVSAGSANITASYHNTSYGKVKQDLSAAVTITNPVTYMEALGYSVIMTYSTNPVPGSGGSSSLVSLSYSFIVRTHYASGDYTDMVYNQDNSEPADVTYSIFSGGGFASVDSGNGTVTFSANNSGTASRIAIVMIDFTVNGYAISGNCSVTQSPSTWSIDIEE